MDLIINLLIDKALQLQKQSENQVLISKQDLEFHLLESRVGKNILTKNLSSPTDTESNVNYTEDDFFILQALKSKNIKNYQKISKIIIEKSNENQKLSKNIKELSNENQNLSIGNQTEINENQKGINLFSNLYQKFSNQNQKQEQYTSFRMMLNRRWLPKYIN